MCTPGQERVVVELGDQAVMRRVLGVQVEEAMKVRERLERTQTEPEQKHRRHSRQTAVSAPMPRFNHKRHAN